MRWSYEDSTYSRRTPSGHPRGNGNWPLNRGWPLNKGSSEISIRPFKKVTLFQYKITWKGITEPHEDDNKPVFEWFNQLSLSDVVENKSKHSILLCYCPLNRGKNNRRTLIGTAEKWPRSLNRGGRLKRGFIYSIILTIVSGRLYFVHFIIIIIIIIIILYFEARQY